VSEGEVVVQAERGGGKKRKGGTISGKVKAIVKGAAKSEASPKGRRKKKRGGLTVGNTYSFTFQYQPEKGKKK